MNHPLPLISVALFALLVACGGGQRSSSQPASPLEAFDMTHGALNRLLQEHVDSQGLVDYAALAGHRAPLNAYLGDVTAVPRALFDSWGREDQLAFLINAYNAQTIALVLDHWPVESIKDTHATGNPWDHFTFPLLGEERTLNDIEHGIIRGGYDEARIHFALVCAAISCPPLLDRAWRGEDLDQTLERATREFLANPARNDLSDPNHPRLSALFDWYAQDFIAAAGSVSAFLEAHTDRAFPPNPEIDFLDYDWDLNAQEAP